MRKIKRKSNNPQTRSQITFVFVENEPVHLEGYAPEIDAEGSLEDSRIPPKGCPDLPKWIPKGGRGSQNSVENQENGKGTILDRFWGTKGANVELKWRQNGAKMCPKWSQKPQKVIPKRILFPDPIFYRFSCFFATPPKRYRYFLGSPTFPGILF